MPMIETLNLTYTYNYATKYDANLIEQIAKKAGKILRKYKLTMSPIELDQKNIIDESISKFIEDEDFGEKTFDDGILNNIRDTINAETAAKLIPKIQQLKSYYLAEATKIHADDNYDQDDIPKAAAPEIIYRTIIDGATQKINHHKAIGKFTAAPGR